MVSSTSRCSFSGISALVCCSWWGILQSTEVVGKVGNKFWVEEITQKPFSCPEGTGFGLTVCQSETLSAVLCLALQVSIKKSLVLPKAGAVKLNTLVSDLAMKTQSKKPVHIYKS